MKRPLAVLCALLALPICGDCATIKTPNVIFILTDDQGWADAHFAGHPYVKTPNLDRFVSQGTRFKQFYVAATVCSPSRCAFMTSHYPARHFIHGHLSSHDQNVARSMPDWLDPKTPTVTSLLKQAGYATGHFGKWHLGNGPNAPSLSEYGIDTHKTAGAAPDNDPSLGDELDGPRGAAQKDPYFRANSTRLIVDEAIQFIKTNKDRPFYANVWTLLPHAPLNPTPEQLAVYADLNPRSDDPAFGPWMQKYLGAAKDIKSQMRIFCASLTDLDTQLGRLLDALDTLKLADNTIVFLSSDNGPEDYRIGNAANAGVGSPGPLRARKRSMFEGGIRTFGLLRWPGHVPAGRVDETSVLSGVDWLPTVCKLTGVPVPPTVQPDGEDVSDIWLGQSHPRSKPLHWEWLFRVQGDDYTPPMLAIRDGNWKLFVNHDGSQAELYDISKDISEEQDVATQQTEVVKNLSAKALEWAKSLPPSKARDSVAPGKPLDAGPAKGKSQAKAGAKPALDRAAIFKAWDANHDGRMSLEEYLAKFPNEAEGRLRFPKFDSDKDGMLTEAEFVGAGRKK